MLIRCNVKDCVYNNGSFCTLDVVEIDSNGKCMNYKEKIPYKGNIVVKCKCGNEIIIDFEDCNSTDILKRCSECGRKISVEINVNYG